MAQGGEKTLELEAPSPRKSTKVTLMNWKRVANVPGSIDGLVQAVQWRDYIVFLDNSDKKWAVKWHKRHLKFSRAIVTGFRFPVPSMVENFRGAVLAT